MPTVKKNNAESPHKYNLRKIFLFSCFTFFSFILSSCYTIKQGYYQVSLLFQQEDIEEILKEKKLPEEELKKIETVQRALDFGRNDIGLTPGDSYKKYIKLDRNVVTFIVQAAEKRKLKRVTWWFPIVGSMPYLGFFVREDAKEQFEELKEEGYDVTLGGASAFSLLGYFPDPLYSSMIRKRSYVDIVELILHEITHRTIYIPGFSAFNENLADFVAFKSTQIYLDKYGPLNDMNTESYIESNKRNKVARAKFNEFLNVALDEFKEFYKQANDNPELKDDETFLKARQQKFDEISDRYNNELGEFIKDTNFKYYFRKGKYNNSSLMGWSLYHSKQEPFEKLYSKAGSHPKTFLSTIKGCLLGKDFTSEEALWKEVSECQSF